MESKGSEKKDCVLSKIFEKFTQHMAKYCHQYLLHFKYFLKHFNAYSFVSKEGKVEPRKMLSSVECVIVQEN